MSNRQAVLEEFLNSDVRRLELALYYWHERYYEVLPLTLVARRHNWAAGWIKRMYKGKIYSIREVSRETLKKYYPHLTKSKQSDII